MTEKEQESSQSPVRWMKKNQSMLSIAFGVSVLFIAMLMSTVIFMNSSDDGEEISTEVTLADGQKVLVRQDADSGIPSYMTGNVTPPPAPAKSPEAAIAFFDANKDLYKMSNPAEELSLEKQDNDNIGMTHVRLAQVYRGVPVYGSEMVVHFSAAGNIVTVNGSFTPAIDISVEPGVTAEAAVEEAVADIAVPAAPPVVNPPLLVIFPGEDGSGQLAWKIILESEEPLQRILYFIDAQSGGLIAKYDDLRT